MGEEVAYDDRSLAMELGVRDDLKRERALFSLHGGRGMDGQEKVRSRAFSFRASIQLNFSRAAPESRWPRKGTGEEREGESNEPVDKAISTWHMN